MTEPDWRLVALRLFWGGVDLLFPPRCAGCGQEGVRWCGTCQSKVHILSEPICKICGLPLEKAGVCGACQEHPPAFSVLRAWAVFDPPIRQALHTLKYRRNLGLGEALARQMQVWAKNLNWDADLLIPMPLSRLRFQERGYNQVGLVARPLALWLGWRYRPQALSRTRHTRSQVGLTAAERRENVRDAFTADPGLVAGKRVVLMDDVATTGATLDAAARTLLQAGASDVRALAIARALPRHGLQQV